jgi:uncharacterized membrane protein
MNYLAAYLIALVIFLILDAIWLSVVARHVYMPRIGELLLDRPKWLVAGLFYVLYVAGLLIFAISSGFNSGGPVIAAFWGALFGFFTYLTYNATNLATLKGYDPMIAVLDTAWGTCLGAVVSFGTIAALARLGIGEVE